MSIPKRDWERYVRVDGRVWDYASRGWRWRVLTRNDIWYEQIHELYDEDSYEGSFLSVDEAVSFANARLTQE